MIWQRFSDYYGKKPRLSSHLWIHEEWDDRGRNWQYEDAYQLETEASILMNRLTVLLDIAIRQRGRVPGDGILRCVG